MAITATFSADFSKFDAALKNAQVNLKSFEVSTKNVGQQLNRAFSTFSGEKLIRDANLAVAAVGKLGGAAKLTASEQARLNATLTEALAKYKALGQVAPKEMQDLANATKQVVAPTMAASESVGSLVAKYVSIGAAIALAKTAIGGLIDFLASSVTSYAQAEAAQNRMVAALRAQGTATPTVIKQYAQLASTIQRTTAFSDDAANEMQALFVQIGDVGPEKMEKATTAATDLAAGLGLDLATAATLVSKALQGNVGALGRYGIKLDEAKVAAEGADAVFSAIQDRFGGQAVAQLDTYSGKLEQLANNWDNVKEAIGKALVTNELATFAMNRTADALNRASEESENAGTSIAAAFQGISQPVAYGISLLEDYVGLLNEIDRMGRGIKAPALPQAQVLPNITGRGLVEWEKQNDAIDKARKAAEAAAKAYRTWAQSVTGLDKAMKAAALEKNLARLTAEGNLNATATQAIIKEYDELRPSLDRLSAPLEELRTNYQDVLESTRAYGAAQAMVNTRTLPDAVRMFQVGQTAVEQFGVRLKYLESTSVDLAVSMNAIPGAIKGVAVTAELASRSLGQRIGTNITQNLTHALGNIPDIVVQGLLHGASLAQVFGAVGAEIGAAIGGGIGASFSKFASFLGPLGTALGSLLGPLLETVIDKIIVTRAEKTQERIREEYGVAISEGLAQAIEDAAERFGGDRQAAKLFNLDRIIAEGGGLSGANIDVMLARLRDVFSAIEQGAFTTEEAMDVIDKNFGEFAAFVTRDGALASAALLEIIELNERFGTSSKEVAEFVTAQLTGAIGGLTTFLENAEVTSQSAAQGIAASVFGIFEELTQQGASPLEAIKQLTPVLEKLDAQLKAAGFSGGAAFDQIRAMAALANDAVRGPMIEAITGLGTALEGLHNSGVLNQEMFAGLSTQITDTYNKLIAQGTDGAQALALVGPSIQTLWELQQDFGYAVDEATQKLIDQGIEAGVVGDEHRSAQEQMAKAMDRTADAVEYLAEQFGYVAEEAKKSAEAIDKIPEKVNIKVNYDVERLPNPDYGPGRTGYEGGERPEYFAKGGPVYAQHGMWAPRGTDTVPAMLTPGEVVLPREVVAALRSSSSGGGVTVNLAISAIDGADVERVVKSPEFRRALTSAVSGNVGGYRTDLRTAIGVR